MKPLCSETGHLKKLIVLAGLVPEAADGDLSSLQSPETIFGYDEHQGSGYLRNGVPGCNHFFAKRGQISPVLA
jgi:hypothetical protein